MTNIWYTSGGGSSSRFRHKNHKASWSSSMSWTWWNVAVSSSRRQLLSLSVRLVVPSHVQASHIHSGARVNYDVTAGWLKSERKGILTTNNGSFSFSFIYVSMPLWHKFALSMAFSVRVRCCSSPSSSKNDSHSSLARSSSLSASSIFPASSRSFLRLQRDFRRFSTTLICHIHTLSHSY